ncbi:MAG: polyprenyl synthetase family protein [Cyanobacteria bacterium]|nr:polyprenyl synthetase family protein [Cyanobacteriota bacterium]MDA1020118.1 polyprenyl synthetase family protein [Cyanobacteriota bacterium]
MLDLKIKTIKEILEPVATDLQELDNRLINEISPSSRALCSILQEIFAAGGKRLRPALSFLLMRAFNQNIDEASFLIAEISELIHTASLVHDDIIDNSLIRRGKANTNSKFDNAITVISGDFMFARAAVNLGRLGINEITMLYASVLEDLCDGEIRQVERKFSTEVDWDYYYSKTYKKTASLFEASTKAVAIKLANPQIEACANYGKELGLAFQIIDDVLDYNSDTQTLGKPACSDLKEGQVTAPLLHCLEQLAANDQTAHTELVTIINQMASDKTEFSTRVLELIETTGSINYCKELAKQHCAKAITAIEFLETTKYKTALIELANWVAEQ